MKHGMRAAGHECDRFVVQGIECPFRREEEEDDDEDDEDPDVPEEKKKVPVGEREREAEEGFPFLVPARRRPSKLIQQALDAVSKIEAEKALEVIGEIQEEGELSSIPRAQALRGALSGQTAQQLMAVLSALAVTAALARMPAMRLATPGLAVASSERHVARQFSLREAGPASIVSEGLRQLFGFEPGGVFSAGGTDK